MGVRGGRWVQSFIILWTEVRTLPILKNKLCKLLNCSSVTVSRPVVLVEMSEKDEKDIPGDGTCVEY